jgi:hypothetical protein
MESLYDREKVQICILKDFLIESKENEIKWSSFKEKFIKDCVSGLIGGYPEGTRRNDAKYQVLLSLLGEDVRASCNLTADFFPESLTLPYLDESSLQSLRSLVASEVSKWLSLGHDIDI